MTLEANLRALEVHQPGASAAVSSARSAARGVWRPSRKGPPSVTRDGSTLVSAFDPETEARRAVPEWSGVDFIVLPSLGAGYLAEAVSERYPDVPLVIAESDPGWVVEVCEHRDLRGLWSRPTVTLVVGPDASVVGRFLENWACSSVQTLPWRPTAVQEAPWHRAVDDEVARAQARAQVNPNTALRFGDLWRRNLAKNEAWAGQHRVGAVASLMGRAEGCCAVVAAAGPSLADSLGWLENHRTRVLLIAVDTAWPSLAARGLEPDLLLVLDGQYWNSRHVDLPPPPRTLVISEFVGPPRAFRMAPDRTLVTATSVPLLRRREVERWGDLGTLSSGGSVATTAWSLAVHLGCSEVGFAGLDLGYPRGLSHVPGSQFEEAIHRRSRRLMPAETQGLGLRGLTGLVPRPALDGGWVLSDPRMDLYRSWLEASVTAHPETRAYNLGTRGSLVRGLTSVGNDWRPQGRPPRLEPPAGGLVPGRPVSLPPFEALRSVGDLTDRHRYEEVWAQARDHWGAAVWDKWAGRAWSTWARFPSPRSRRAVEEMVTLTLSWESAWTE